MCSVALGSMVGLRLPSVLMSSWNSAINRSVTSEHSSPTSLARLMILSSTSVKFLQYVTLNPRHLSILNRTSNTVYTLACPMCE